MEFLKKVFMKEKESNYNDNNKGSSLVKLDHPILKLYSVQKTIRLLIGYVYKNEDSRVSQILLSNGEIEDYENDKDAEDYIICLNSNLDVCIQDYLEYKRFHNDEYSFIHNFLTSFPDEYMDSVSNNSITRYYYSIISITKGLKFNFGINNIIKVPEENKENYIVNLRGKDLIRLPLLIFLGETDENYYLSIVGDDKYSDNESIYNFSIVLPLNGDEGYEVFEEELEIISMMIVKESIKLGNKLQIGKKYLPDIIECRLNTLEDSGSCELLQYFSSSKLFNIKEKLNKLINEDCKII